MSGFIFSSIICVYFAGSLQVAKNLPRRSRSSFVVLYSSEINFYGMSGIINYPKFFRVSPHTKVIPDRGTLTNKGWPICSSFIA